MMIRAHALKIDTFAVSVVPDRVQVGNRDEASFIDASSFLPSSTIQSFFTKTVGFSAFHTFFF